MLSGNTLAVTHLHRERPRKSQSRSAAQGGEVFVAFHQPTKKTLLPKMGATVPSLQKIRIPAKRRLSTAKQAGGVHWWDVARFPLGGDVTGKGERLVTHWWRRRSNLRYKKEWAEERSFVKCPA